MSTIEPTKPEAPEHLFERKDTEDSKGHIQEIRKGEEPSKPEAPKHLFEREDTEDTKGHIKNPSR